MCAYDVLSHPVAHERVPYISSGTRVSPRPEAPRRLSCTASIALGGSCVPNGLREAASEASHVMGGSSSPACRPQFNFGHGLARDLTNAGVDIATWHQAAANRTAWIQLTQRPDICKLKKPPSSVSQAPPPQTLPPPQLPQPTPPSSPSSPFSPPTSSPSPPRAPPALPLPNPSPILAIPSAPLLPTPCSPLTLASPSILRCSRRLADKARQAGGRRVYSLKPIIRP